MQEVDVVFVDVVFVDVVFVDIVFVDVVFVVVVFDNVVILKISKAFGVDKSGILHSNTIRIPE